MNADTIKGFNVSNPYMEDCHICAGINSVYDMNQQQCEMLFDGFGSSGYCHRTIVDSNMEITITNMTFSENVTMSGTEDRRLFDIAFCLGAPVLFRTQKNRTETYLGQGENCVFNGMPVSGDLAFKRGQHFHAINVRVGHDTILKLFNNDIKVSNYLFNNDSTPYFTPFSINRILHDLMNCKFSYNTKRLYLEAKIMELLAVYFEEVVFESTSSNCDGLTIDDVLSLKTAKNIIDSNVEDAPTLRKLAGMVCMNEFKLKSGFKKLYGTPVHAYIIDKKMDTARFLLECQRHKVIEVAQMVGYNDASYFAGKFKEKFGVNPSEYMK